MARSYQQLYLGCGTYEGSKITLLAVAAVAHDGFPTWQEAVTHFRACLIEVVKLRGEAEGCHEAVCERCIGVTSTETAKFCQLCGSKLPSQDGHDLDSEAAAMFISWFETELHEFQEWDELSAMGWEVSNVTSGGFVVLEGFNELLENWNSPEEYEGPDRNGDRFWNTELVQTGEQTLDE
jgi:hypothetical protein